MIRLIVSASISSFFFGLFGVSWEDVDARIAEEYPGVEFVAPETLLSRYEHGGLPLVVDVREGEEFAVSHLPLALNIQTGDSLAQRYPDRNTEIVVYCSVGYRAAGVAARLEELGYTRVRNLHHAIFEWANRGYPLVNDSGGTRQVHPYNRAWGSLVDKALQKEATGRFQSGIEMAAAMKRCQEHIREMEAA